MDEETKKTIEELKKRIEELEKRTSVVRVMPTPQYWWPNQPSYQQGYFCNICQRWNCGQVHVYGGPTNVC